MNYTNQLYFTKTKPENMTTKIYQSNMIQNNSLVNILFLKPYILIKLSNDTKLTCLQTRTRPENRINNTHVSLVHNKNNQIISQLSSK